MALLVSNLSLIVFVCLCVSVCVRGGEREERSYHQKEIIRLLGEIEKSIYTHRKCYFESGLLCQHCLRAHVN